jgi:hypothetical protein
VTGPCWYICAYLYSQYQIGEKGYGPVES